MQGQFTERVPMRGQGRPKKHIPAALQQILDTTYEKKQDYVVEDNVDSAEVDELINLGRLYAKRRGLSFRYRITDEQHDGMAKIRFRLTDKRQYARHDRGEST
jgi:hypothetical protein